MPSTATGYYLLDVGAKINPPLGYMFNKGEIRLQTFKERNGIIKMQEKTHKDCFAAPDISTPRDYSHIHSDILCENTLQRLISKKSAYTYFSMEAHHPTLRKGLGLPKDGLQPGIRLLRAKKYLAGIQSKYLYVSLSLSAAAAHEEDLFLSSANILYCGEPKLWTIIDPRLKDLSLSHLVRERKI